MICKKCGYISSERLPEKEATDLKYAHLEANKECLTGHVTLKRRETADYRLFIVKGLVGITEVMTA